MQFIPKGSPFHHDKAPATPNSQGTSPTTGLVNAVSCGTKKYLSIFFRAGELLRNQRPSHAGGVCVINASLTQGSVCEINAPHTQGAPDRGHHIPALTVTSGARGVGFDVASSGTPFGFTQATQLELFNQLQLSLYRVSLCSRPGGPAATRPAATPPSATHKVSLRRQTPAGLDAGGMTTMPETPDKCHHTRWQSSHLSSCARLISQRLGAASEEVWVRDSLAYLTVPSS